MAKRADADRQSLPMDALSAIFETVRIRGSLYFWASFASPWGVKVPRYPHVIRYHLILRGHCWVRVEGSPDPIRLEAGDMVAIPHGRAHLMSDGPKTPCTTLDRVIERSGFTGRGALVVGDPDAGQSTRLVCGHFAHDAEEGHPLFRALPASIVVRGADNDDAGELQDLLRRVAREVSAERPGTTAVVTRLTEVLFVQMLRSYATQHPARAVGWAGFADAWVGPALMRIHEEPGADWSVATLAKAAGLSRTAFALRFRRLMGTTPVAYVARWRLTTAKARLRDPSSSIADIASRVGYQSESAFNRAFTKAFGLGPGAFRRLPEGATEPRRQGPKPKR